MASKTHARLAHMPQRLAAKHHKGVHFADFKPQGVQKLWTHVSVNLRHFAKDYSLALILTALFLALVGGVSVVRTTQRTSLLDLLATVTSTTGGDDSLLSTDKTNAPEKGNVTNDVSSQSANPAGSPSSFAITPTSNPSQSGGNTPGGSSSSGGSPSAPFSAAIGAFVQDSVDLECSGVQQNKPNCGKRYTFSARVNTQNGPGAVNFGWRSNLAGASEDANYSAASGTSNQTLQKSINIPCLSPGTYTMQFVVTSPTQVQSGTLSINHNCVGI